MSNPLGNIMKQAQKMQEKMAEIQKGLASKTCEASAGGGMVTATVEMLEDLIVAAVNEAFKRTQQMVSEEMASVTAGLGINLPGL
jgi:DNA-binding protein YbaB